MTLNSDRLSTAIDILDEVMDQYGDDMDHYQIDTVGGARQYLANLEFELDMP